MIRRFRFGFHCELNNGRVNKNKWFIEGLRLLSDHDLTEWPAFHCDYTGAGMANARPHVLASNPTTTSWYTLLPQVTLLAKQNRPGVGRQGHLLDFYISAHHMLITY